MSIVAFEPPVLTTETTCGALPTEFANQGVAAAPTGASTRDATTRHAPAHSEASNRRMDSIVGAGQPGGQVKVQTQLGHRAVIVGPALAGSVGEGRNTKRHN